MSNTFIARGKLCLISPTIRRDLQSHRAGTVVEVYMEEGLTSPQERLAQSARWSNETSATFSSLVVP